MKTIICSLWFLGAVFLANAQQPLHYWTFEGKDILIDQAANKTLNIKNYAAKVKIVKGVAGNGIEPVSSGKLIVAGLLKPVQGLSDFTLELAFNGGQFMFSTFPKPDFRLNFSSGGIAIRYSVMRKGRQVNENWNIPLKGAGVTSYHNLANGQWHHFVLVARRSGNFEIWIDGKTDVQFTQKISSFDSWVITGNDGLRLNAAIDELAFYNTALSPELIQQHAQELQNGE
ncbi:MAG TPA: hypothetical protein PKV73_15260, partial [Agriterribacter sp.]|nr:hypothetical protein [Agriterribacter sp.]